MTGMLSAPLTLARLGGVARGTQLQDLGFTRRMLSRSVAEGEIIRIRDGVFAVPSVADDLRTAIAHGGAPTCVSELRRRGVWVLSDSTSLHVWMGAARHVHPHTDCDCRSHYYRGRPPLGRADLPTALVHLQRCEGDEAFFAAFESAWRMNLLSRAARSRIRAALPARARWLVDLARGDADSGLESILRLRLHILGIPVECQVRIDGVGVVDVVIGGRLIVEADGKENHDDSAHRHRDRSRDAVASRLGYETLRFDYAQIIHDWPTVQAAILGALRRLQDYR